MEVKNGIYAIQNKRNKKFVCGTDYRYHPPHQILTNEYTFAILYSSEEYANMQIKFRRCGKNYKVIEITNYYTLLQAILETYSNKKRKAGEIIEYGNY